MRVLWPGQRAYPHRFSRGFTLIEILMVIVIVSILVGIALPSYQNSIMKGRRSDAKAALLDVANRQESFMQDRSRYTDDMEDLGFGADPMISQEEYYSVDAVACAAGNLNRCYRITATPVATGPQADDTQCTSFSLESTGEKSATGSAGSECW